MEFSLQYTATAVVYSEYEKTHSITDSPRPA
jgi:hypothetical protein